MGATHYVRGEDNPEYSRRVLDLYYSYIRRDFIAGRWQPEQKRFAAFLQAVKKEIPEINNPLLYFWRVWTEHRQAALPRSIIRDAPFSVGILAGHSLESWFYDFFGVEPGTCEVCGQVYDETGPYLEYWWYDKDTGVCFDEPRPGTRRAVHALCRRCAEASTRLGHHPANPWWRAKTSGTSEDRRQVFPNRSDAQREFERSVANRRDPGEEA